MSAEKNPKKTKKDFKALALEATPKWEILKQEIFKEVNNGAFVPGDRLPGEMALCEQFDAARTTVRRALDALEKEGIIERRKGKGTFLAHPKATGSSAEKTNIFCLILPQVDRDVYPVMINGFGNGASRINHQVLLATTRNDIYRQGEIMLQALDKKMAGVALVPMLENPTPPHHIRQLQTNGIPVVLCNRPVEGVSVPLVTWDFREIGRIAARYLLKRGHHRIGYFANIRHPMTEAHAQGMQEVLAENGMTMQPNDLIFANLSDDLDTKKGLIQERLAGADRPTALLCNDDTEADNVFGAALEIGLKVPDDLAIVGFGIPEREVMARRRLTSVIMSGFDLGAKAVNLLTEMRFGKRPITSDEVFLIPLNFVQGETA